MGAAAATIGIFLPAFVFVGLTHPFVARLSQIHWARAVLDGINVAAVALMLVAGWQLGRAAIVDPATASIALVSAVLIGRFRINSALLILAAAAVGLLGG
jgi:chromate transporter